MPTPPSLADDALPRARPAIQEGRLVFIDALRGLAALAVAVYHIERYGPLAEPASALLPAPIENLIESGWMGVQAFFVISGFVIAYSLRRAWVTPGYLGNYALRRSLRLDPPYWATIGLVLVLHAWGPRLWHIPSPITESPLDPGPTGGQILSHAFYLQNALGYGNLSVGLWTLCIEVQFYLLYTALLGLVQACCGASSWRNLGGGAGLCACFFPLALVSLAIYDKEHLFDFAGSQWLAPFKSDACVLRYFWMFFLGMLIHWTLEGRIPAWAFWSYATLMAARYAWFSTEESDLPSAAEATRHWTIEIAVAWMAGVAIYVIGSHGMLGSIGRHRWLQFLGRISYSLYLIHYPVSHVIVNWGYRWTGDHPGFALMWTVLAVLAAIAAAYLLYVGVERPTLRLASRWRPKLSGP
ncbi:MAG: acyltransferase family protein [Pirellulales bacterium]